MKKKQIINDFLFSLPYYESHYGREKENESSTRFLNPFLNISKLYTMLLKTENPSYFLIGDNFSKNSIDNKSSLQENDVSLISGLLNSNNSNISDKININNSLEILSSVKKNNSN